MKLLDFHCDTLSRVCEEGQGLKDNFFQVSLQKAKTFDFYGQFFALYCGEKPLTAQTAPLKLIRLLQTAQQQFIQNEKSLMLCRTHQDMEKARQKGKTAAFLSIEGAELVSNPVYLERAFEAGVRLITLTWNYKNSFGSGAAAGNYGLTDAGKAFVQKIEKMGIIPDVSHLSDRGFWDVQKICRKPFVATHSNSRAVCDHIRNLTDEQFMAICTAGGLVGINLYSPFLSQNGEAKLSDVVRHIEHFSALGGEKHLSLGCDLDGCSQLPQGIQSLKDLAKLYDYLLRLNYKEDLVYGIFFGHLWNFLLKRI